MALQDLLKQAQGEKSAVLPTSNLSGLNSLLSGATPNEFAPSKISPIQPQIDNGLFRDNSILGIAKNTFTGLFNPENLPLGVGTIVKSLKEEPVDITAKDFLQGLIETGKGIVKYPVNVLSNLAGVPVKFNIPGLGEVTNRQFNAAQRISNGENMGTVLAEEGSGAIFDTLFLVGMGQKLFAGRPTVIAKGELPPSSNITVKQPPKTGRLYTEPVATKPIPPELVQKLALDNYNPELPTYFKMTGKANGKIVGEIVQIKPSYFDIFTKIFKGDINKVPNAGLLSLSSKETSLNALEQAKPIPEVPKIPVITPALQKLVDTAQPTKETATIIPEKKIPEIVPKSTIEQGIDTTYKNIPTQETGKDIRKTILESDRFVNYSPEIEKKVGVSTKGFDFNVWETKPAIMGLVEKGEITDSFLLLKDKALTEKIFNEYIAKKNKLELNKLKKIGATEQEITNVINKNTETLKNKAKISSDTPKTETILPKTISDKKLEIIGYKKGMRNIYSYLKNGNDIITVNADKLAFVKKYLPNAELRMGTDINFPVQIIDAGKLKGLLMPIRGDVPEDVISASKTPKKDIIETKKSEEPIKEENGISGFNPKNLEDLDKPIAIKETDKIIKRSEIAKELSDKLGVLIRRGKFNQKAIGIFKREPQIIRLKKGGLATLFHEVGHFLDDKFKLSNLIDETERKALMKEYAFTYEGEPLRQRQEAFAEFLRFRMTGQEAKANELAPKFSKIFDEEMKGLPEIKDVLDVASADYKRWQEQPAVAKILSHISLGTDNSTSLLDRTTNSLHNLYTMALDDLHPLSEFSKMAGKLSPERDPYILARNLRGWIGKANVFLTKGTFGKNFWEIKDGKISSIFKGKSFTEIMKPIEKTGKLDEFRVYLISKRVIELSDRSITSGVSKKDAETAIEELGKKNPEFEQTAKDLYKYEDDLLNFASENGLVGEQGLTKIKTLNKNRVPFYRVMEEVRIVYMGNKKVAGNMNNQIRKIRGSEREIIDPIESIIKDTYAIINASERNNIGVAMANVAKTNFETARLFEEVDKPMVATKVNVREVLEKVMPQLSDLIDEDLELTNEIINIFRPVTDRGANMLNVNFGDDFKVFQVEPDLFKALQGLNTEDAGMIMRILATPAKLLRAGATLSPDFMVRNPIRDQWSALVFSKYGYIPGWDLARGMFELFKKGDVYNLWRMAGGEHSMLVSLDRGELQKKFQDLTSSKTEKVLNIIKHPIDALRILSELGEQATRLGEMKRGLEAMDNPIASAYASREVTLDFARIGAKTKGVNSIIAFFNANMQGNDRLARGFKNDTWKTSWKILLGITLPSILLYFANRDDKRWKEIPQWQKDLFWIVFTEKHIYRIPKPFGVGQLFGSVPERILEYMDMEDPQVFKELEKNVANGFTPGLIPTFMIPLIENITNYSFFLDRPIVSRGKENLPPEAQYNSFTSELSKMIGEKINYSPAKIDNLVQGYTGGLGKYATSIMDKVLTGTGIKTPTPKEAMWSEDFPVVKAFMIKPPVGSLSESVNRIYNEYNRISGEQSYVKKLYEQGEIKKATEFAKNSPYLVYYKMLSGVVSTFTNLNKSIEMIRLSKSLTPEQKKEKINELETLKTNIASKVLKQIK